MYQEANEILNIILALVPILFIIVFFIAFTKIAGKLAYKALTSRFLSELPMPTEAIRISQLRYGGTTINGVGKIAEQVNQLHFKLPLAPHISIPFGDIGSIKVSKGLLGTKVIHISFKDENIPNISVRLKANQLKQFPHLLSLAGQVAEKKEFLSMPSTTPSSKAQFQTKLNYFDTDIKSKAGDIIRILLIFLVIIISLIVYANYA